MNDKPRESDWKRFRSLVPELRERYLAGVIETLISGLQREGKNLTERFWDAEETISGEVKVLRRCLDRHSRSRMIDSMVAMYCVGMLRDDDLEGFSDELQECVKGIAAL